MRDLVWASEAWEDYLWWQTQDRKTLKRINALLRDIARNGQGVGIGMAEPLKGRYSEGVGSFVYEVQSSITKESAQQ